MLLKYLEEYIDLHAFREDLRKIGVAFVTAGVIGIFMTHLVSLALAYWLTFLGSLFLVAGLIKLKRG